MASAAERVGVEHLSAEAGQPILAADTSVEGEATEPGLDRAAIEAALARCRANVSAAARELGLHRTQLYRLMKLHGIE